MQTAAASHFWRRAATVSRTRWVSICRRRWHRDTHCLLACPPAPTPYAPSIAARRAPPASVSAPADVTAQAAAPDFSLTATPATLNLDAGLQGSVAVTITPNAGFNNYVSLSCAGLPLFTTCTFLPSNVEVAGKNGLSTMTLNTTAPSGKTGALRHDTGFVYCFLLPGRTWSGGAWSSAATAGFACFAMLCVVGSLIGRRQFLRAALSLSELRPFGESRHSGRGEHHPHLWHSRERRTLYLQVLPGHAQHDLHQHLRHGGEQPHSLQLAGRNDCVSAV